MDRVDLSTGRLYLRSPLESDVPAIVATCRDPETARWTTVPAPYDETDARSWLETVPDGWAAGSSLAWVVADVTTGGYQGSVALRLPPGGTPDVGYMSAPWARGRGLMTEALAAVTRFAHGALGLPRVELLHFLGNTGSCRVAEKCGYAVVGVRPGGCEQRGRARDAEVHVHTVPRGPLG